jgi:hypothetical protein
VTGRVEGPDSAARANRPGASRARRGRQAEPAGVIADHYPRKRILVITSLTQMIVVATVVPAALTQHVYLAHLIAVGFAQGAAGAFYPGASRGAVRRIVPTTQLREAMARTQARDQGAALLGPPAGGVLFGRPGRCRSRLTRVIRRDRGRRGPAAHLLDPVRSGPDEGAAREPLRRSSRAKSATRSAGGPAAKSGSISPATVRATAGRHWLACRARTRPGSSGAAGCARADRD